MRDEARAMKGITCCADCVYYNMKKHKCNRGCSDYPDGKEHFYRDCPLPDAVEKCEYDILQQALEEANGALRRKHGTWIGEGDGYSDGGIVYDTWYCSECDCCEEGEYFALPNFCPNCGADMRGETE